VRDRSRQCDDGGATASRTGTAVKHFDVVALRDTSVSTYGPRGLGVGEAGRCRVVISRR
jgi:hypothetical protein